MYCIRYVVTLCSCVLFLLFSSVFVFSLFCTTILVNKVVCVWYIFVNFVLHAADCKLNTDEFVFQQFHWKSVAAPEISSCRGTTGALQSLTGTPYETETAMGHETRAFFEPVFPVSEFATNSTCLLCGMRWQPGIAGFFPCDLYKII